MLATQEITVPVPPQAPEEEADANGEAFPRRLGSIEQASLKLAALAPPDAVVVPVASGAGSVAGVSDPASSAGVTGAVPVEVPLVGGIGGSMTPVDVSIARATAAQASRIAWNTTGDPTEAALLALGMKSGLNLRTINEMSIVCPRLDTVPFDSATKLMCTVHDLLVPAAVAAGGNGGGAHASSSSSSAATAATPSTDGLVLQRLVLVKGAPDVLLQRCATQAGGLDPWTYAPLQLERWLSMASELSREGLRVLALASMRVPFSQTAFTAGDVIHGEKRLHLHCLVSIIDPPRDEVPPAIAEAHSVRILGVALFCGGGLTVAGVDTRHAQYSGLNPPIAL